MENQTVQIALWGLAVFTLLGLLFGFALAAVAIRFQVPVNPMVEQVRDKLPSANCGACGFAGCQVYAEAVVEKPEVPPNLCAPGRAPVAQAVASLTHKDVGSIVDRLVVMRCHGTSAYARQEAEYAGVETCSAARSSSATPRSLSGA
jgi:electron transport complex protein RnfB